MPGTDPIKQDATKVVNAAKITEVKVTSAISQADLDATKAKQAALAKLNQEESWIEKNPGKVTLIVVALVGIIILLLAKSCA